MACQQTLEDWLSYLDRHEQAIQPGLSRIAEVARRLDLLTFDAQVITVAGTNGKGSTVASLEAIYGAAGYRVASYTSPHLITFNERIRVNQQPISDEALCTAFAFLEAAREEISLSYFEITTLAALWYFKQLSLDVIILEVGLGGRWDATNIIDADLAMITTVDLDHQEYLGHTKEEIGYEKAGILRRNKPFIYADVSPPVCVASHAQSLKAPMYSLDVDYTFCVSDNRLCLLQPAQDPIHLPLPNINLKAAASAIFASILLREALPVEPKHWIDAMQTVSIRGRQQMIKGVISTIFDVAHNPQAVSLLADYVAQLSSSRNVHAVFSALKDKDLCGLISPMISHVDFWYPALLSGKRAANESMLLEAFHSENRSELICYNTPIDAYNEALRRGKPGDLIVVYGSFLTVSAVMTAKLDIFEQGEIQ